VLVGASVASETTAAAVGQAGIVRRDPMAMLPFCGYNFGDYWSHWLEVGRKLKNPPRIFHVNWFRRDASGKFLWPGFGDNLRVIEWMLERAAGRASSNSTPIGNVPRAQDLNTQGLHVDAGAMEALLKVDPQSWRKEIGDIRTYLQNFGSRLPKELAAEVDAIDRALEH
jgi:phosphoenolpyruvate carboxykinase (GTP)